MVLKINAMLPSKMELYKINKIRACHIVRSLFLKSTTDMQFSRYIFFVSIKTFSHEWDFKKSSSVCPSIYLCHVYKKKHDF